MNSEATKLKTHELRVVCLSHPLLFIRLVTLYIFFSYYLYFYLYLMTTIGLNMQIKGEIRHRSVANGLHNF